MNALVFQILAVAAVAGGPPPSENTLLKELVEKGVEMPDGQTGPPVVPATIVRLPAPTMAEGLNAAQQEVVLAKTASAGRTTLAKFLGMATDAPVILKVGKIASNQGEDVIRTVNLNFVVYGDWEVLTGEQFSKGILKAGKTTNQKNEGLVSKAGYLSAPQLLCRKLTTRSAPDLKEYFLYTTFNLFDQVELSDTRFGMATTTPTGVVVAAKVDPRFAKDKEFPNQWREIARNALGNPVLGPPHPYSGSAFYAKVTRLIKPQNAIFVEFHHVFYEPQAWFGENANLMPSKLRQIIPFEVKQFRMKLARATREQAEKKPGEEKPGEEKPGDEKPAET